MNYIPQETDKVPPGRRWLSGVLVRLAHRIDGTHEVAPTHKEVVAARMKETRLALLDAESEQERWNHTVAMLTDRVQRYRQELED